MWWQIFLQGVFHFGYWFWSIKLAAFSYPLVFLHFLGVHQTFVFLIVLVHLLVQRKTTCRRFFSVHWCLCIVQGSTPTLYIISFSHKTCPCTIIFVGLSWRFLCGVYNEFISCARISWKCGVHVFTSSCNIIKNLQRFLYIWEFLNIWGVTITPMIL